MEIKYIKSPTTLVKRVYVNKGVLDLSKEVLWVSLGQRAAELLAVKGGDLKKKFCSFARCRRVGLKPSRAVEFFFDL